jgi:hypothetical protein
MSFTTQTQMSKSPFQNLDAVSALKELSDVAAASCSGGSDQTITLYDGDNDARSWKKSSGQGEDNIDDAIIGDGWNNRATKVNITGGTWRLYSGNQYTGDSKEIGAGNYDLSKIKPNLSRRLTSFLRVA